MSKNVLSRLYVRAPETPAEAAALIPGGGRLIDPESIKGQFVAGVSKTLKGDLFFFFKSIRNLKTEREGYK